MKRKCLFFAVLLFSCVLFLQTGCQEQAKSSNEALKAQKKSKAAAESDKPSPRIPTGRTPAKSSLPILEKPYWLLLR